MSILLLAPLVIYPLQSGADDSVTILANGGNFIPNEVVAGLPTTIRLFADPGNFPHRGTEVAVYDPREAPNAVACSEFPPPSSLPGPTVGTKWELRADTDNDMDFTDVGGFAVVRYDLTGSDGIIDLPFSSGGKFTITPVGSASVTPPAPSGDFAWQDVSLSGPNTFGTDHTNIRGTYQVFFCGKETEGLDSNFIGTARLKVVENCLQRIEQHEDPIDMNTVVSKNIAKTIHAEKHIYDCSLEQGDIPVIADMTIIAEIFEDMDTKSIIKKQVFVITCIKEPESVTVIGCHSDIPETDVAIVRNCSEEQISHPQEMNTVTKGSIVKTIDAQKEIFKCTLSFDPFTFEPIVRKKVMVVLFTEIWEDVRLLPNNPIIKIIVESMRCTIDESTPFPTVESCEFKTVKS